jgi:hypothetical protein
MEALEALACDTCPAMASECMAALRSQGIDTIMAFCFISVQDIDAAFADPVRSVLINMLDKCKGLSAGAAKAVVREAFVSPRVHAELPATSSSSRACPTSRSSVTALSSFTSFTRRVAFGESRKRRPAPEPRHVCAEDRERDLMVSAKQIVHEVFVECASGSPRFTSLQGTSSIVWDMQLDVYRLGSRSHKVVRRRASMARGFFIDVATYKWDLGRLTPFEVAAWVRGRVSGGTPSAVAAARQVLRLVEAATDYPMHLAHPMVKSQLQSDANSGKLPEEPAMAKEIEIDIIVKIEDLCMNAEFPTLRCVAGFFALLACSSLRASDALRTRSLKLTADAITGVSRMKGKRCWTRWFADRHGFRKKNWAEPWIADLVRFASPGPDFIMCAPTASLDGFLPRPAEYADMRRSLHVILMILGMNANAAVEYNPHGFRHVLVSAGQQLRSQGVVDEGDLERLGHWSKGSNMPRKYDSCAGVSELKTRETLMRAIRNGWRPSPDGCLPAAVSSFLSPGVPDPSGACGAVSVPDTPRHPAARSVPDLAPAGVPDPVACPLADEVPDPQPAAAVPVGHIKRKKLHLTYGSGVSICKMWQCGTTACPSAVADFTEMSHSFAKCSNCWR